MIRFYKNAITITLRDELRHDGEDKYSKHEQLLYFIKLYKNITLIIIDNSSVEYRYIQNIM